MTISGLLLMAMLMALLGPNSQCAWGATSSGVYEQKKSLKAKSSFNQDFVTDQHVRKQVRFWEAVFQKYDSSTVVIHDVEEPLAMVDVINFDHYILNDGTVTNIASSEKTDLVSKYISRYDIAVERFAKYKEKAIEFGPIEKRVFEVYQREPTTLAKLYSGNVRFRGQGGLSDTFVRAAHRAQEYLPYMEDVFKKQGLPIYLTRLPFVESMFNVNARSKVGASGIWQFMPGTAREYMHVSRLTDERNSPYKATIAAAKLLQDNYTELGAWPLAVTAYNHGRAGMAKASRQLGTIQLGKIIQDYKSPSFGFASRNFYAEFVAAVNTYELLRRNNKIEQKKSAPSPAIEVALKKPTSLRDIAAKAKIPLTTLASLNLCLTSHAISSQPDAQLPKNYVIRLSKDAAQNLKKSRLAVLAQTQPKSKVSRR